MFVRKSALEHLQSVYNDGIKAFRIAPSEAQFGDSCVISLGVNNIKLWKMLVLRPVSKIN